MDAHGQNEVLGSLGTNNTFALFLAENFSRFLPKFLSNQMNSIRAAACMVGIGN